MHEFYILLHETTTNIHIHECSSVCKDEIFIYLFKLPDVRYICEKGQSVSIYKYVSSDLMSKIKYFVLHWTSFNYDRVETNQMLN